MNPHLTEEAYQKSSMEQFSDASALVHARKLFWRVFSPHKLSYVMLSFVRTIPYMLCVCSNVGQTLSVHVNSRRFAAV